MIVNIPQNTHDLFVDLEHAATELPIEDRNAFVLDLLKFVIDWQFNYLAFKEQLKLQATQDKPDKGIGSF